ncbi:hypothetical protein C1646_715633 [Rhizophagus diaphanus]|nr:hypothetical protein C1646_715633 [Rhizophagus diaphanus] [Rhizophagus sp. MUCL 43196]
MINQFFTIIFFHYPTIFTKKEKYYVTIYCGCILFSEVDRLMYEMYINIFFLYKICE